MLFNQFGLMLCLLLLFGTTTIAFAVARRGDRRQLRAIQFFRIGFCLSACSYLFRLLGAPPGSLHASLSFLCNFSGTLLMWVGWMEYWHLHRERTARQSRESDDGGAPEAALPADTGLPCLNTHTERVMRRAQDEARHRRQCCVDTDHLLLGLLQDPCSAGTIILGRLHVRAEDIHLALGPPAVSGRRLPRPSLPSQTDPVEPLPLTDRAHEVLSLAAREAHRFDKSSVGTDHLLLGLILMGVGAAASALFQSGVTVEKIRIEILKSRALG